jgi:hypothetical protein
MAVALTLFAETHTVVLLGRATADRQPIICEWSPHRSGRLTAGSGRGSARSRLLSIAVGGLGVVHSGQVKALSSLCAAEFGTVRSGPVRYRPVRRPSSMLPRACGASSLPQGARSIPTTVSS